MKCITSAGWTIQLHDKSLANVVQVNYATLVENCCGARIKWLLESLKSDRWEQSAMLRISAQNHYPSSASNFCSIGCRPEMEKENGLARRSTNSSVSSTLNEEK